MSVDVEMEAGRWIKSTVKTALGDAISGAYLDMIPESKNLPAVRFQCQRRADLQEVAGHIIMSRLTFLVVATVQGESVGTLADLSAQIFGALHRQSGETDKARILQCTRMETYSSTDTEAADTFRHAGGMYEIYVQELPEIP